MRASGCASSSVYLLMFNIGASVSTLSLEFTTQFSFLLAMRHPTISICALPLRRPDKRVSGPLRSHQD
ncbi:hypothetical protein PHLGIDRAFT_357628 [Phlebiopsis gigantea 11061_1 CR5-6]|uniref:Uncharacterized protein n=1 Tax=Phlebiopsis gigantea (strain 11061_1 CR5-6) TaxID=745531 RepID=A0A0C3S1C7_PHLG1|nr:hypothetical protein PHLGIDRAFT_357628 [Phlebiopsis gigantea 11061_1 CR5-6]